MPRYKNQFKTPTYVEHTIVGTDGNIIGKLRIKPNSVMWKPVNAREFFAVDLEDFTTWICNTTQARKVRQ